MTGVSDRWRLGRRPQLDGLRGVAIALVVAGHAQLLPGTAGPVGVTAFFALSGFLITALLLEERDRTGQVSLNAFYLRRARRLFPALGAYLAVAMLLTSVGVSMWAFPVSEYVGPLLYVENWLMALRGSAPHALGITWSLAIEEQFYLVWPLVVIAAARYGWRGPLAAAAVGTVVAAVLRVLLWDGGEGLWRVYYGTDTRMDCLLIGCLFAVLVHRFGVPSGWSRWWFAGAALALAPLLTTTESVHLWLPTVTAAGTCVVIAAALTGGADWLTWSALRWLGRRSYALYLWHYPLVYVFAREMGVVPLWAALLGSLALAELSWWLVERPFLRPTRAVARSSGVVVVAGSSV